MSYHYYLLFLLLFIPSTGCTPTQKKTALKIAYISKLKNESFHDNLAKGVNEEAVHQNVALDIYYGESQQDVDGQIKFLKDIAEKNVYQGVMLAPNDSEKLIPYVKGLVPPQFNFFRFCSLLS